jgi:gliding motility-associated protein GldM
MAIPKQPRQAMINMMYLVLTAMLALNISAEVLQAFNTVDSGIKKSMSALESGSMLTLDALTIRAEHDPDAQPYVQKAIQARAVAKRLFDEIENVKDELRRESGIKTNSKGEVVLRNEHDTHTPTLLLINRGKGARLKQAINDTRDRLLTFFDPEDVNRESRTLPIRAVDPEPDGDIVKTWEEAQFEEMPMAAVLALLSLIQNDVRSSEAQVLKYLLDEAGMMGFDFDKVIAQAIPQARWVTVGDKMNIDLMVAAYDSKVQSEIFIGPLDREQVYVNAQGRLEVRNKHQELPPLLRIDEKRVMDEGGIETLGRIPGSEGTQNISGAIKVVDQDNGQVSWFPFTTEYQAIRPAAVVSPDYMNVLYIGVDNPISISVPGFTNDKISATISDGTLSRTSTGYVARVSTSGSAYVSVSAKTETGVRPMGRAEFKVKRLPDPDVTMGNYGNGCVPAGAFRVIPGLTAQAPWFYFPVNYRIQGFIVSIGRGGQVSNPVIVNGPLWSDEVKRAFANLRIGDKVWIDDIIIVPPDEDVRKASLSFKVCS